MDYFAIGFVLVVVAVIGLVAMTARIALSENSKVLNRIRDALEGVRLFKMLRKRQVDVQNYLQDTDVSEIRRQIATCEACPSSQSCEAALKGNDIVNDFSFCPNNAAIEELQGNTATIEDKDSVASGRA